MDSIYTMGRVIAHATNPNTRHETVWLSISHEEASRLADRRHIESDDDNGVTLVVSLSDLDDAPSCARCGRSTLALDIDELCAECAQ